MQLLVQIHGYSPKCLCVCVYAYGCVFVWQRGFTPHRLAIPREGHVNGINHEHIIVFRADAKAHAHATDRRRDIALRAIAAGA